MSRLALSPDSDRRLDDDDSDRRLHDDDSDLHSHTAPGAPDGGRTNATSDSQTTEPIMTTTTTTTETHHPTTEPRHRIDAETGGVADAP